MEPGDFYTTTDASRILRISPQRVRKLISDGKLKAERRDDRWLIHAFYEKANVVKPTWRL